MQELLWKLRRRRSRSLLEKTFSFTNDGMCRCYVPSSLATSPGNRATSKMLVYAEVIRVKTVSRRSAYGIPGGGTPYGLYTGS